MPRFGGAFHSTETGDPMVPHQNQLVPFQPKEGMAQPKAAKAGVSPALSTSATKTRIAVCPSCLATASSKNPLKRASSCPEHLQFIGRHCCVCRFQHSKEADKVEREDRLADASGQLSRSCPRRVPACCNELVVFLYFCIIPFY